VPARRTRRDNGAHAVLTHIAQVHGRPEGLLSRVAVLSAQTGRTRICLALALTSGASLARAQAAEVTASVVAERVVVHLDRSGFVIMRKPIPVGASMIIRAGAASKASSAVTPGQKISFPAL
jgi:hypothetical protein